MYFEINYLKFASNPYWMIISPIKKVFKYILYYHKYRHKQFVDRVNDQLIEKGLFKEETVLLKFVETLKTISETIKNEELSCIDNHALSLLGFT